MASGAGAQRRVVVDHVRPEEITHALYDIVALWVAIVLFIRLAWPVRRTAALLFVPYFLWVTLAVALNFEIWRLNS